LFCVKISPIIAEWLINFIQKMYLMVNKNQRTIDKQDKEPNDDIIALFLISILRSFFYFKLILKLFTFFCVILYRFNLENDLLIRDTGTRMINRKTCFRMLFN